MDPETSNKVTIDDVYVGQLWVSVKASDSGERRSLLSVCAQLNKCDGSPFAKVFSVNLTDESDPFFYYHLKLNADDYQNLRVQQGLLVDFNAFPQKFAHLLEVCLNEETHDSPKFVLLFTIFARDGTGQLNVVETNPFKHLVHLSLKLVVGSDTDVRRNLARRLASLKEQNQKLAATLKNTESDLAQRLCESKRILSARQTDVDQLQVELQEQAASLSGKWQRELFKEQERANMVQGEMKKLHEDVVNRLRESLNVAELRASELGERLRGHESTVRELHGRVGALEDELRISRHESFEAKKEKVRLEREGADLEGNVGRLTSRISVLERDACENEARVCQLRTVLETTQDQKNKLAEETERMRSVLEKRESSLKMLAEEVNKGNEIIRKLQAEIKCLHTKFKVRTQVVQEQEKRMVEAERVLENFRQCVSSHETDARQHNEEIKKLQELLAEANAKLDSDAKLIKTNENVINWLNKQLNECQVDRQKEAVASAPLPGSVGPFSTPFVTSTPAGEGVASFPPRPMLQYHPTQASVQLVCKRPAFETIPEDTNSQCDKNPPLEAKYLQSKGRGRQEASKVAPTSRGVGTRFPSQMRFAPPAGANTCQDSRYKPSAYFPS